MIIDERFPNGDDSGEQQGKGIEGADQKAAALAEAIQDGRVDKWMDILGGCFNDPNTALKKSIETNEGNWEKGFKALAESVLESSKELLKVATLGGTEESECAGFNNEINELIRHTAESMTAESGEVGILPEERITMILAISRISLALHASYSEAIYQ